MRGEPQNNYSTWGTHNDVSQHTMVPRVKPEDRNNQNSPFNDPAYWDLPFLQARITGQSQRATNMQNGGAREGLSSHISIGNQSAVVTPMSPNNVGNLMLPGRSAPYQRHSLTRITPTAVPGDSSAFNNIRSEQSNPRQIQTEVASSLGAASTELPCTVKLRLWSHDLKDPCAPLHSERCRLTIPHAVLCSEMGAHFSPCGRFLAVCVACILPNMEAGPGHVQHGFTAAPTSPTRHPLSSHQVMYELRIYSLEEATFGSILASRAIRAAHCLTSIQFSPTSENILLAYGRRHSSLLKSVLVDGDTAVPIYTILEVYRVCDMELVKELSSADDEVNVACFHPWVGGGLVYGTKEGKLRIFQCDGSHGFKSEESCVDADNMMEV